MATLVRLRIILDTENDVFRDIEIPTDAPLLALHDAILKAFGWEAGELASFYRSNEAWDRGDEFPLLDLPASDLDLGLDDEDLDFEDRPLLPKKPAETMWRRLWGGGKNVSTSATAGNWNSARAQSLCPLGTPKRRASKGGGGPTDRAGWHRIR